MNTRVVAIDGTAGSGKSTLGRELARRLGLAYVNTGLMYRAVAAGAQRAGVSADDEDGLARIARGLRFELVVGDPPMLEVEGWAEAELTTLDVDRTVSAVSRHPGVRSVLRERQRALGATGAVMEGRDIGSVVFPDAAVKVFLVASAADRVRRRAEDRGSDDDATRGAVLDRDTLDARTTPATPAPGAVVIDTTATSADDSVSVALDHIARLAPELLS